MADERTPLVSRASTTIRMSSTRASTTLRASALRSSVVQITGEPEEVPVFSKNTRPVEVSVRNLNYWLTPSLEVDWESLQKVTKCQRPMPRQLLDNVNLTVRPGQLLAVLGSSGSGKTTLLDIMACRHEGGDVTGSILLNGHPRTLELMKEYGGYVLQEDRLLPNLTVHETLMFVARLKMPADLPLERKRERVDEVIGELGLIHAANMPVGGATLRGISGGERRRVSIATQLLLDPSILFLDEPTSGLDSFTANNVVATLQSLARSNRTIITTIHSPRSDIVRMFDLILILSQGRTVYFGAGDQMVSYFASAGYQCPMYTNPCDYCLDLATIDFRSEENEVRSRQVVDHLVKYYSDHPAPEASAPTKEPDVALLDPPRHNRVGFFEQLFLLWVRTAKNKLKGRSSLLVELIQSVAMGLIVGAVFYKLGHDQVSVQDRYGLFYIISTMYPFMVVLNTVAKLYSERPSLYTERQDGLYDLLPFFLGKQLAELPFELFFSLVYSVPIYFLAELDMVTSKVLIFNGLIMLVLFTARSIALAVGSAIARFHQAAFTANLLFTLMLLPCGFIINLDSIWSGVRWLADISFIAFSFQALSVNEFVGVEFYCPIESELPTLPPPYNGTFECPITRGEQALQAFAFEDVEVGLCAIYIAVVAVFFRIVYYLALRFIDQRPR